MTGDEAYLRRLAMSQGQGQPNFAPPRPVSPPAPVHAPPPAFTAPVRVQLGEGPAAPSPPPSAISDSLAVEIEAKRKAAAAIAARLGQMAMAQQAPAAVQPVAGPSSEAAPAEEYVLHRMPVSSY